MKMRHLFKSKLIEMMFIILISLCGGLSQTAMAKAPAHPSGHSQSISSSMPARHGRARTGNETRQAAALKLKEHVRTVHEQHKVEHARSQQQRFNKLGKGARR